jgi:hypothetical protein
LPIRSLLEEEPGAFSPEEVRAIADAFEAALGSLGLASRDDPAVLLVAKITLEFAMQGELHPVRLSELVIKRMAG